MLAATILPVKAADLDSKDIERAVATYKQNEMRFTRDYVGKTIEFEWTFDRAKAKLFGDGYRVVFGGGLFGGADCDVQDQKTIDAVIDWNKGQRVHVYGTIHDVTFGTLQLKSCTIEAR